MRCCYPQYRWIDGEKVFYPCGHCPACLKNKRSEKALRGYLESLSHENSVFLTLTYSDDNLPRNSKGVPTLRKAQFDSFVKKLRSFLNVPIRVLASGEYSSTGRPHYHCCFFGVDVDAFIKGTQHYHSNSHGEVLEDFKIWSEKINGEKVILGGCLIAPFDIGTAFYVAKYLIKSVQDKQDYEALGIEPEFVYQSRRPALGKQYALEHRNRLLKDGFIRCKGRKFKIPRYFMDKILNDGSDEYQDLKDRLLLKHLSDKDDIFERQYQGDERHLLVRIREYEEARARLIAKGK